MGYVQYIQSDSLCEDLEELTGNGSQNVWDEHLHQALVQRVVAVAAPAQHRIVFTQHNQA